MEKNGGGVRPIAVGCTIRRLAAKVVGNKVMKEMASILSPRQLGYGVSKGAEAAVHAARLYINNLGSNKAVLKLDFINAFNSIRRDKMLSTVKRLAPSIYPFVHSAYSSSSSLFWGDKIIPSAEGVQQGDPLGPLLFCLTLHDMCCLLKSELCLFYLDDGSLGGFSTDIIHDVEVIKREAIKVGLELNPSKSEVIGTDSITTETIQSSLPGVRVVDVAQATLLGSPIGDITSISATITAKTAMLKCLGERLKYLQSHDAYLLLRHSLAIPKLLYCLRTSPCFISPCLQLYDEELRSIMSTCFNLPFTKGHPGCTQASLPVKFGGLGIRSAVQLAPSAFLASAAASSDLVLQILPPWLQGYPICFVDEALTCWSEGCQEAPPVGTAKYKQKAWDSPRVLATVSTLLSKSTDPLYKARLLAACNKESGLWLNSLPVTSLGLRMDNLTIRIAIGLRLGLSLCRPHSCHHCGFEVTHLAVHGLSCRKSEGRHHRHASINDTIHRAMTAAKIPSRLEPTGLFRSDGKRPDGITIVPWQCGKLLVWDVTCPDTYAPSYSAFAAAEAGAVANQAEHKKCVKYAHLDHNHIFTPIAIETSGVYGSETLKFLKELGHRLKQTSGECNAYSYLLQRLSVAVQRGNATSVMGSVDQHAVEDFFQ